MRTTFTPMIVAATLASSLFAAAFAQADTFNWQYHSVNAPQFWLTANQIKFAEKVEEATDGQLNITVYPGGAAGFKGGEILDAISDNLLQMGEVWGGHVAGQERVMEILDLPQFVPGDLEFRKKLWAALQPEFADYLEKRYDVVLFDYLQINPRRLYTKMPVEQLSDIAGLKIRALGLADAEFVRALGGEATTTNWTELYTALQQGVVDGHMAADGAQYAMKFYEVTDHIFDTQNAGPSAFILINRDAFEELPSELQEALFEQRKFLREANVASYAASGPWAREKLLTEGMTVHDVPEADERRMRKVGQEIVAKWAADLNPDARKIYDVARRMIDEYYASKR